MQPSNKSSTDEELARDARAGSVDCFEELVRRYQVPLLRFLQRKNPREAEDLLQESFLRAFNSLDKFRDGYSFKTWLFTLSYRLMISNARRAGIKSINESVDVVASDVDNPHRFVEQNESRAGLWHTVRETLGDEVFAAVWLFYVESISPREIAGVMGRSWVWVKQALHRARKKLREPLESHREISGGMPVVVRGET